MRKYTLTDSRRGIEISNLSLLEVVAEAVSITAEELDAVAYLHPNNSVTFNGGTEQEYNIRRTE